MGTASDICVYISNSHLYDINIIYYLYNMHEIFTWTFFKSKVGMRQFTCNLLTDEFLFDWKQRITAFIDFPDHESRTNQTLPAPH